MEIIATASSGKYKTFYINDTSRLVFGLKPETITIISTKVNGERDIIDHGKDGDTLTPFAALCSARTAFVYIFKGKDGTYNLGHIKINEDGYEYSTVELGGIVPQAIAISASGNTIVVTTKEINGNDTRFVLIKKENDEYFDYHHSAGSYYNNVCFVYDKLFCVVNSAGGDNSKAQLHLISTDLKKIDLMKVYKEAVEVAFSKDHLTTNDRDICDFICAAQTEQRVYVKAVGGVFLLDIKVGQDGVSCSVGYVLPLSTSRGETIGLSCTPCGSLVAQTTRYSAGAGVGTVEVFIRTLGNRFCWVHSADGCDMSVTFNAAADDDARGLTFTTEIY